MYHACVCFRTAFFTTHWETVKEDGGLVESPKLYTKELLYNSLHAEMNFEWLMNFDWLLVPDRAEPEPLSSFRTFQDAYVFELVPARFATSLTSSPLWAQVRRTKTAAPPPPYHGILEQNHATITWLCNSRRVGQFVRMDLSGVNLCS